MANPPKKIFIKRDAPAIRLARKSPPKTSRAAVASAPMEAPEPVRELPPNLPFLRFEGIAGRGGMATVWKAWHLEYEQHVAVKVLDASFAQSGQDVRQFMIEARTMTALEHPGIVRGYGADYVDGRYYFIMEYVDGYTFATLLNRKIRLPEVDALIICESIADAMKYAWDTFRIVHCDIKPENIMTNSDGQVKVTDLGLCQSTRAFKSSDIADDVVGTPAYISPEQIYGDTELDCRSDIYSLGATLYHLATGHILFPLSNNDDILRAHVDPASQAPNPKEYAPGLSDGFAYLLARMLVKDKDERLQTWDDVFNLARAVETGQPLPPFPGGVVSSVSL